MINKLTVANFKAFGQEVNVLLGNNKNLLLYGENGAGKSSLYEALRVVFFKERIESKITANTPEDRSQLLQETWSEYNNKVTNQDFSIKVNDTDYSTFDVSNYQVFMISMEELYIENKINLKNLLETFCFNIADIDALCSNQYSIIEQAVNNALVSFKETVTIQIDQQDDLAIKIIDPLKNIERKVGIKSYFNEAKLNLIVLLILINAIEQTKNVSKSKLLILDDFITSLDASNRTFLISYLFAHFQDTQLFILTHNISFYNLIMHIVNEVDRATDKWAYANLFEINNIHKIYIKTELERAAIIKAAFNNLVDKNNSADIESIGNRIRKKFEVLLYEYSKLLTIGAVEDSKNILGKITKGEGTYFYNGHTSSDLIETIQRILNENNTNNLSERLQSEIDVYKYEPYQNFKKILSELKLYQKVTMHPMSHGIIGMSTFTIKEIKKSIELLEIMEKYIKDLVDSNVATI